MRPYLKIGENKYVPLYPGNSTEATVPIDVRELPPVQDNHLCGEKYVSGPDKKYSFIYWAAVNIDMTSVDYLHQKATSYNNTHDHRDSCTKGNFCLFVGVFFQVFVL